MWGSARRLSLGVMVLGHCRADKDSPAAGGLASVGSYGTRRVVIMVGAAERCCSLLLSESRGLA